MTYKPRFKGDNFNNWMYDIAKALPKDDQDAILDAVKGSVKRGVNVVEDAKGNAISIDDMTFDDFIDFNARNLSENARNLGMSSALAKQLRHNTKKNMSKATPEEVEKAIDDMMGVGEMPKEMAELPEPKRIQAIQDTLIQFMVSHPGTTALNVKGSLLNTVGQVTSDALETVVYGGKGAIGAVLGKKGMRQANFQQARANVQAMRKLVTSFLRPDATLDEFRSYGLLRPDAFEEISNHYAGGVKKVDLDEYGIDQMGAFTRGAVKGLDAAKDVAQKLTLVSFQDQFFKSQMMAYSMAKNVYRQYGENLDDLIKTRGAEIFTDENWAKVEAAVIGDVADNTYSRKMGKTFGTSTNPLEFAATVTEEVRKIPVLGMMIPFGRFFNNTVNFMGTYSGVKSTMQLMTLGKNAALNGVKSELTKESLEQFQGGLAKTAVGLSLVGAMMYNEKERIDMGLGMFEVAGEDGTVVDHKLNFPYNFFLGLSRVGTRVFTSDDQRIHGEEVTEFMDTFGPTAITRTAESALSDSASTLYNVITGTQSPVEGVKRITGAVMQTFASAATRPLDPVNSLIGGINESGFQDYSKKNNINAALRYLDQMPVIKSAAEWAAEGRMSGEAVTKESATDDNAKNRHLKFFGSTRFSNQSYTQKVMNHVGKAEWRVQEFKGPPEVNEYINAMREDFLEQEMEFLWNKKSFKNGGLSYREEEVSKVFQSVNERVKNRITLASDDLAPYAKAYFEFTNKYTDESEINRAKKLAKIDKSIEEMSPFELDSIASTIEDMKRGYLK